MTIKVSQTTLVRGIIVYTYSYNDNTRRDVMTINKKIITYSEKYVTS